MVVQWIDADSIPPTHPSLFYPPDNFLYSGLDEILLTNSQILSRVKEMADKTASDLKSFNVGIRPT